MFNPKFEFGNIQFIKTFFQLKKHGIEHRYANSKNMDSTGKPSGSWNYESRWTSFTSAITLRAAKVSSLQSMYLLMGKIRRAVNKQMRNRDKLQHHVLL